MKFPLKHNKCALNQFYTELTHLKCTWLHVCTFTMKKKNSIVSDLCCVASTAATAAAAAAAAEQSCCCSFHMYAEVTHYNNTISIH